MISARQSILDDGETMKIQLGKNIVSEAVFDYNFTSNGSATNNLSIDVDQVTTLSLYADSVVSSLPFYVSHNSTLFTSTITNTSATAGSKTVLGVYTPNLNTSHNTRISFGTAATTFNAGQLSFNNIGGTGSASNTVSLGVTGSTPIRIDIGGNLLVDANVLVTNATTTSAFPIISYQPGLVTG